MRPLRSERQRVATRDRVVQMIPENGPTRRAVFDPQLDVPLSVREYADEALRFDPATGPDDLSRITTYELTAQAAIVWPESRGQLLPPEICEQMWQHLRTAGNEQFQQNPAAIANIIRALALAAPDRFVTLPNRGALVAGLAVRIDGILTHERYYEWAVAIQCADRKALHLNEGMWSESVGMLEDGKAQENWEIVRQLLAQLRLVAPERYSEIRLSAAEQQLLLDDAMPALVDDTSWAVRVAADLSVIFADQVDYRGPGNTPRIVFAESVAETPLPERY